jgi:hypothetical protein
MCFWGIRVAIIIWKKVEGWQLAPADRVAAQQVASLQVYAVCVLQAEREEAAPAGQYSSSTAAAQQQCIAGSC